MVIGNVKENKMINCDYKLILMDVEMPIMNGFDSSKLIIEYVSKL